MEQHEILSVDEMLKKGFTPVQIRVAYLLACKQMKVKNAHGQMKHLHTIMSASGKDWKLITTMSDNIVKCYKAAMKSAKKAA